MFPWFKSATAKTPDIKVLIEAASARVAELKAAIAVVVVEAADGVEGAQERYRAAKDDLAKVTADLELLVAAKAEHTEREARRAAAARAALHRDRVALVKADLDASVEHAETFQRHLAAAVMAFDELLASRGATLGRGIARMPEHAELRTQEVRRLVSTELYRLGARLNSVGSNTEGLPDLDPQTLPWRSNPALIPPLVQRLRQADERTLAQLERATP